MANSIKFKNNNYIDSTGITHNRDLLSTLLTNINNSISGMSTNITTLLARDYVVESGTNSNGSYIKYDSGVMICWGTKNVGASSTNGQSEGSLWYVDIGLLHRFPVDFKSGTKPNIQLNVYTNDGYTTRYLWAVPKNGTFHATGINGYRIYSPINTTFNYSLDYIAIGFWK